MQGDLIGKFLSPPGPTSDGVGDNVRSAAPSEISSPFRPFMLDLETQSGTRHAFPYAHLLRVVLSPSQGIKICFATHNVVIRGRCLTPLFESIRGHTAARITATSERHDSDASSERPVVHQILVQKVRRSTG